MTTQTVGHPSVADHHSDRSQPALDLALRAFLELDIILTVVVTPFFYGGADPAFNVVASANAIFTSLAATLLVLRGAKVPTFVLYVAPMALGIASLQLIPFPQGILGFLAPGVAYIKEPLGSIGDSDAWRCIALSSADSAFWGGRLAQGCALFLAASVICIRRGAFLRILAAIAFSASLQAAYGYIEWRAGGQVLIELPRKIYGGFISGTFVNRDHFANFAALGLGAAFGLSAALFVSRERGRALILAAALAGIAALLGTAVVLSGSRGCTIAIALAVPLGVAMVVLFSLRAKSIAMGLFTGIVLVVLVLAFADEFLLNRFRDLEFGAAGYSRPVFWRTAVDIGMASPALGVGWGSFEQAFPVYASKYAMLSDSITVAHAHCDWAEWFASFGFAGWALLLFVLWRSIAAFVGNVARASPARSMAQCGVLLALAAFAIHAVVDFPLAIPATAGTAAILLGMLCACGGSPRKAKIPLIAGVILVAAFSVMSLAYSFDGFRTASTGAWYPGHRADLLAKEASISQNAGNSSQAASLTREALENHPADPYLWISLAASSETGTELSIRCIETARGIAPSSLYVAKNSVWVASQRFSPASADGREKLRAAVAKAVSDFSGEPQVAVAACVLKDFGDFDIARGMLDDKDLPALLCALSDRDGSAELMDKLARLGLSPRERAINDQRIVNRVAAAPKNVAWLEFVTPLAEAIKSARPDLYEEYVLTLVRLGRTQSA
ncbi:MAG: O-antigen ligase family protein, partial [Candidatus Brocadiia bacterium]